MSMNLFEKKREVMSLIQANERILALAASDGKRDLTADEYRLFDANMKIIEKMNDAIEAATPSNSIFRLGLGSGSPLLDGGVRVDEGATLAENPANYHPKAAEFRRQFSAWMSNSLSMIGGGTPQMEATAPSGPISVGSGGGIDSIGITVPTDIMPYLPSYYSLDSFGLAGATQYFTDHTRPMTKPILAAGAANSTFTENAAPTTSQPFGISGFTFGGTKYARLVLASYESLMNSELPLQGAILDELLASLATTLTTATTTQLYTALTGASSTLEVGAGGSNDIYSSLIDLRHAVPPRFDLPSNKWMLSRATLATIRNKRASTSGVAMFDPTSDQILGRDYVINDNFDSVCGAGFVAFGSWADGCYLRRTPVMTRVFLEAYAASGQVGYRTQQWADAHFLAELAGAAQPPTFQPLYYTSIASES